MSFDVKRSDVDAVGYWIASYSSQVSSQLDQVASAAQRLSGLESLQGAAADSIKAYWGEMHTIIPAVLATSRRF